MKFETAAQAAARLGVTVRAVQKWASEGRLEGAQKVGRDWMIPFGATTSKKSGKRSAKGGYKKSSDIPYPLFQIPYTSGDALEYIKNIPDDDKRNINLAQLYYFMGELDKTIEITEQYLDSPNNNFRLSSALFYGFANLCGGHIHKTRFAADIIYKEIEELDLSDHDAAEENAIKIFTAVVIKTQLHIPFENVPLVEEHIKYMPEGLRVMACYLSAYKAYLEKDYQRSIGIAQTAINCATQYYPICEMYCYIICAIDYINLLQIEKATEYVKKAWDIAHTHKVFMPFVEHYSLLQGLLENNFKKSHPADYEKIISLARNYNMGWYEVYNHRNKGKVTVELTPTEFTIAMLYTRNWRAKEIAAHMHISDRTVTNYIQVIYEKLNINCRKDLEEYVLN